MIKNRSQGCSSIPPTPKLYPYLVFSHGKSSNVHTFYDIPQDRHYTRRLPYLSGKFIRASCQGWILTLNWKLNDDGLTVCSLCNVISMAKIDLPPFEYENVYACVLSLPPTDPNCILAFFGEFGARLWRPGQENWVSQGFTYGDPILHAIACEGKIYCQRLSGEFFTIDTAANGNKFEWTRLGLIEFPRNLQPCYTQSKNVLIELGGEIYCVCMVFRGNRVQTRIKDIDVFKFRMSNLDWILVDDIGDAAFFTSEMFNVTSSSSSALALGLKPNSIYLVNMEDKALYVFDIKKKRLHQSLPCLNVVHNLVQIFWLALSA